MSFLAHLINGISLGSIYAIIALGYTMVYGIAKMLNFAHGDVIMIGCYFVYTLMSTMGMNPIVSILVAILGCTILGITIEKIAYKPLRKASKLAVLITAISSRYGTNFSGWRCIKDFRRYYGCCYCLHHNYDCLNDIY